MSQITDAIKLAEVLHAEGRKPVDIQRAVSAKYQWVNARYVMKILNGYHVVFYDERRFDWVKGRWKCGVKA